MIVQQLPNNKSIGAGHGTSVKWVDTCQEQNFRLIYQTLGSRYEIDKE